MSEKTPAELEAEQKAKEDAEKAAEAKDDETAEEKETREKAESKQKDYEEQLKREQDARKKAEDALAESRFKEAERKRKLQEAGEEDDEEKPLTASQLESILAKERQETDKRLTLTQAEAIATKLTGSEAEKKLVLELYQNRTFPSHLSLEEQIEEAVLIANKKKILGENSELKRALRGKDGVNDNAAGTHQEEPKSSSQPTLSGPDAAEFSRLGFKWNSTTRLYEKKLTNGKTLIRDPKSHKTYLR